MSISKYNTTIERKYPDIGFQYPDIHNGNSRYRVSIPTWRREFACSSREMGFLGFANIYRPDVAFGRFPFLSKSPIPNRSGGVVHDLPPNSRSGRQEGSSRT